MYVYIYIYVYIITTDIVEEQWGVKNTMYMYNI